MKNLSLFIVLLLTITLANPLQAQRKVLAAGSVKILPAVEASARNEGTGTSLNRVAQAIDGQLIDALNGTRKFEIVARSDLDALLEEGGISGQAVDPGEADYLVVPVIDDFQDYVERAEFSAIGTVAQKRKLRLGMVARIYDTRTSRLIESTNFQLDNKHVENLLQQSAKSGEYSDELLRQIARDMAGQIAGRVLDVIFPARILAMTGKQVTINRGDGTGIALDQLWDVFALGEELIDPDTGESLGRSEVMVGQVRVDRITPRFSTATIVEDYGIEKNAVVRMAN